MDNGRQLKPGQIQLISAGRGITHSEFNPSRSDPQHFLQIWIQPRERGLTPSYTEWHLKPRVPNSIQVLAEINASRDGAGVPEYESGPGPLTNRNQTRPDAQNVGTIFPL
jgi:redox-sensitive bicupin YhaK (pirin superfamily)